MRDFIEGLSLSELIALSEFTERIMLKMDNATSPEDVGLYVSLAQGCIEKQIDSKLEEHAAMHEALSKLGGKWHVKAD